MLQTARRISQGFFLLLFLLLFLKTDSPGTDSIAYPVKLFLDASPLLYVSTIIAARDFYALLWPALAVVLITVLAGRFFCGWFCPLGTVNSLVGRFKRAETPPLDRRFRRIKYLLLTVILISALFPVQIAGLFDPIALLLRSLSLAVFPLVSYGAEVLFGGIISADLPLASPVFAEGYRLLKGGLLPLEQPRFAQGFVVGGIFLLVLVLNLKERRLWCRYLCPLGALLGILSRYSLVNRNVAEDCADCPSCRADCVYEPPGEGVRMRPQAECLRCLDCDDLCPEQGLGLTWPRPSLALPPELNRRRLVGAAAAALLLVPLARISPAGRIERPHPLLIRPPGALPEEEFLARCVKCGKCMKVCITNGIQPALLEGGLPGLWSPVLVFRIGYCEYNCTLCGQVCPTSAIARLPREQKTKVRIGLAMLDKNRCLPYAHHTPCIVCEEVCPTPKKAIWFQETRVKDRAGKEFTLKQPVVDLDLCIGCGICETKCPVVDKPAIYVTSIGESRSRTNQLLLP